MFDNIKNKFITFLIFFLIAFVHSAYGEDNISILRQQYVEKVKEFNNSPIKASNAAAALEMSISNKTNHEPKKNLPILVALSTMRKSLDDISVVETFHYSQYVSQHQDFYKDDRLAALQVAKKMIIELSERDFSRNLPTPSNMLPIGKNVPDVKPIAFYKKYDSLSLSTKNELESFRGQLRSLSVDESEPLVLRRYSVKSLGQIGDENDSILLRKMALNSQYNVPETIQKEALLALGKLQDDTLEAIAIGLLNIKTSSKIVKTSAFVLGEKGSFTSLKELVNKVSELSSEKEFPSFESALFKNKKMIYDISFNQKNDKRITGLRALRHIQWSREDRYKKPLIDLLENDHSNLSNEETNEILRMLISSKLIKNDCLELLEIFNDKNIILDSKESAEFLYIKKCSNWVE